MILKKARMSLYKFIKKIVDVWIISKYFIHIPHQKAEGNKKSHVYGKILCNTIDICIYI